MTTPDPRAEHAPPTPGVAAPGPDRADEISEQAFIDMQGSAEFDALRRRFRRFSFPMSIAFIIWYFGYVLLSTYAVDFMKTPVFGNVNLGILLGLLQFVTTFLITWLYIRHAHKNLDPVAARLRAELEGGR